MNDCGGVRGGCAFRQQIFTKYFAGANSKRDFYRSCERYGRQWCVFDPTEHAGYQARPSRTWQSRNHSALPARYVL
jgi:hypothetical protein